MEEYKEIIKAVKGSSKEKRLASQFIGNFFKHFPDLADTAIDAQFDLCEDDDTQVGDFGLPILFLLYLCYKNIGCFIQVARQRKEYLSA